ncbi:MAG: phage holin family protein, partial [bacterium]
FHVGFNVDGFWSAFLGALIVSIVSIILSAFIKEPDKMPKG